MSTVWDTISTHERWRYIDVEYLRIVFGDDIDQPSTEVALNHSENITSELHMKALYCLNSMTEF